MSVAVHLIPSLNLELGRGQQASAFSFLCPATALELQELMATLSFLCGLWGFELTPSCLGSKLFYFLNHFPSPMLYFYHNFIIIIQLFCVWQCE